MLPEFQQGAAGEPGLGHDVGKRLGHEESGGWARTARGRKSEPNFCIAGRGCKAKEDALV